jgi:hypothetical protein
MPRGAAVTGGFSFSSGEHTYSNEDTPSSVPKCSVQHGRVAPVTDEQRNLDVEPVVVDRLATTFDRAAHPVHRN